MNNNINESVLLDFTDSFKVKDKDKDKDKDSCTSGGYGSSHKKRNYINNDIEQDKENIGFLDFTDSFKGKITNGSSHLKQSKISNNSEVSNKENKSYINSDNVHEKEYSKQIFRYVDSPESIRSVHSAIAINNATEEELEDSNLLLNSLNAKLAQLGYNQLDMSSKKNVYSLINNLFREIDLANESSKSSENTLYNTCMENRRLEDKVNKLSTLVKCLQQDKIQLENKNTMIMKHSKQEKSKYESWIKELQISLAKIEGQQKGWQAALNRKSAEYERLQSRMQSLQSHRDKSIQRTIELNSYLKDDLINKKTHSNEEDISSLHKLKNDVESKSLEKVKFLTEENDNLRDTISKLQGMLIASKTFTELKENSTDTDEWDELELYSNMSILPAKVLEAKIEKARLKFKEIVNKLSSNESNSDPDERIRFLETRLVEFKKLSEEQDKILQQSMFHHSNSNDCKNEIEVDDQEREEQHFYFNEEHFNKREALIEEQQKVLLKQEDRLDKEKAKFEQEKIKFSQATATPSTPFPIKHKRIQKLTEIDFPQTPNSQIKLDEIMGVLVPPATPSTKALLLEALEEN